ncbi:MAG: amidase [Candidatus Dormibacteraeota bacterium]|nr:amidase [Candidatus Dormibacteraeota bacterium]
MQVELHELNELQAALQKRQLSSLDLVRGYAKRIAALDGRLAAVLELNPEAESIAAKLDRELEAGRSRGSLHGLPILLKDNLDTGDQMLTTAGSLALVGAPAPRDSTVAAKLRAAGAVLLGKANMSEWANLRSPQSSSGWSARGGQCRNPFDPVRSPGGSSSGSGVAVAAGFCAAAIGTETDGSIVSPAGASGVVGLKPTVGLVSRAGVIPISASQDSPGPLTRSVRDAALLLQALAGPDERDRGTGASAGRSSLDYARNLDPGGLRGARIGVAREVYTGYSAAADRLFEAALEALRQGGAEVIDPADIPTARAMEDDPSEMTVLLHELKAGLNTYLATRTGVPVRSLADVISFNLEHATEELAHFGQERLEQAEACPPLSDPTYQQALSTSRRLSRQEGLDAVLDEHRLDALVAPTAGPAWLIDLINGDLKSGSSSSPAGRAGYPLLSLPMGVHAGLPVNITFMGRAFSEQVLLRLAYAFEQATNCMPRPRL